ncbi:hypothetical protein TTHERM_00049050 (macronuclear) [Tetrahymena thermophila SB210]|uniref:Uncharacterized protein n=1 Tax=Tetrahymena thermophila (strain SB210) TaxID=312017 RepID=Q23D86_TETTS|nr:hypothetical protein TTHERM_00049050 [Tetrahymena thermophila SB210]EAR94594.2 hypothetical protein TTHERM_00049050 [Tetrahymena thermophila SB210]|eukprot:XP_001014800.2 hypothetical protein TTHERM_00049050 [Tetrahymena thermophila SB210]
MQEINKQNFIFQRINRNQAVFFPDILYTTQQKESISRKTPKKTRCQSELNFINLKYQQSAYGKDFRQSDKIEDNFFTTRCKDQQKALKFQRTLNLFEKKQQVELTNNVLIQKMRRPDDQTSFFSKSQSLILKIANLNQNLENLQLKECTFDDNNMIKYNCQTPQQKQQQNFLQEYKERAQSLRTPRSKNIEIIDDQKESQKQLRIRGVQSLHQSDEKKSENLQNENFSNKFYETLKILRQEKQETSNLKLNKNRRSLSNHFNQGIPNNLSLQSQNKINKIKQFTIRAINDKNEHITYDSNQFFGYKVNQSPINSSCQPNQIQKSQQETQVFQFKVSKYLQNLKLQQLKQSKQFCNINYASFYPLKINENQEKISKSIRQYMKQDQQIRKLEQKYKLVLNQQKENSNNNISQMIKDDSRIIKSGTSPQRKQQQTLAQSLEKKMIDQIPLLPFSQATNSVSIQNNIDQEYNDDLDLQQYVKNNIKISS